MNRVRYGAAGRGALAVIATVLLGACTSSTVGSDSYATGQRRVVVLANETLRLVPQDSTFEPRRKLTLDDADRELCHRKVAGFAYSKLSAQRPQVTAFATLPDGANSKAVVAAIETEWRARGYEIDTKSRGYPGFPQLHATVGEYRIVVTNFERTAGFDDKPRVSVYVTGRCLNR